MSTRADAKAVARWEHDTRQWAIDTGRDLALDLYYHLLPPRPCRSALRGRRLLAA